MPIQFQIIFINLHHSYIKQEPHVFSVNISLKLNYQSNQHGEKNKQK